MSREAYQNGSASAPRQLVHRNEGGRPTVAPCRGWRRGPVRSLQV